MSPVLRRSEAELLALKEQQEGLTLEYDSLMKEHHKLQVTLYLSLSLYLISLLPVALSFLLQALQVQLYFILTGVHPFISFINISLSFSLPPL